MWSTFFVTDEEGRTIGPAVPGTMAAPGGAPQGAGGLTGLMTARGNKRRRTTSTGHAMSEAQEGKVTAFILCECVFSFRLYGSTLMEPISHTAAIEIRLVHRGGNSSREQI